MGAGTDPRGGIAPPPPGRTGRPGGFGPAHRIPSALDELRPRRVGRSRHRPLRSARHRRAGDPAVPQPRLGVVRPGAVAGAGVDGLHHGAAGRGHQPDPGGPRARPPRLRRHPGRDRRPQRQRARSHARRAGGLLRVLRGRGRRRGGAGAHVPACAWICGPGPVLEAPRADGDRHHRGHGRRRGPRAAVLRLGVHPVPRDLLPGRELPVRPGHGPPGPALPAAVLGGEHDRRRGRGHHPGARDELGRPGRARALASAAQPAPSAQPTAPPAPGPADPR